MVNGNITRYINPEPKLKNFRIGNRSRLSNIDGTESKKKEGDNYKQPILLRCISPV